MNPTKSPNGIPIPNPVIPNKVLRNPIFPLQAFFLSIKHEEKWGWFQRQEKELREQKNCLEMGGIWRESLNQMLVFVSET